MVLLRKEDILSENDKKKKKQSRLGRFFVWLGEIIEDFFLIISSGSDSDSDDIDDIFD